MTPGAPLRVLIVEDEPDIGALIAYQLTREGFRVETVTDGLEALEAVANEVPALVVLDRMLPGLSGDEVLARFRADERTTSVPVLMLTAKREEEDRIEGLELGADDYLTKPFSTRELVLRVHAILRRVRDDEGEEGAALEAGPIRLDPEGSRVSVDGDEVLLTPTEFRLLHTLLERRGRTQSRKQLLERAWSVETEVSGKLHTRTVDMHVRRLRAKLGEVGSWIETVRGFGYRLKIPDRSE